jgi:hypothetical protein
MKPASLGLFIAAAAFGASTVYLTLQLRDERAQSDQVAAQMQALQARIDELEQARALMMPPRPGDPTGQPPPIMARGDSPPSQHAVPTESQAAEPERATRANRPPPESTEASRNVLRMNMRANNRRIYEDVEERLGLTKDQANQLIELLTSQQMARMEQARQDGGPGRGRAMMQTSQQELAAVASLIGADRIALFQEYQKTVPARQEVQVLTRQLEGADLALSEDQRDRMITALTEERERSPAPRFEDSASREEYLAALSEWQQDYRERSASRARGILDSKQFKSYDQYQQWVAEMQQQRQERRNRNTRRGTP